MSLAIQKKSSFYGFRKDSGSILSLFWPTVLLYSSIAIFLLFLRTYSMTDYVGADNDDGMRLVEIRDFLAGQNWFDLMQYRLGLGNGTLMHWSRLIDLPIAFLISFFNFFLPAESAEAVALCIWPLLLVIPFLAAMGLAGKRIGRVAGMHVTLGLSLLFIIVNSKFMPGSIDHHNIQQTLVAIMAAMLLDRKHQPKSYIVAGIAAAFALGVGAETTPFVFVVCLIIAFNWALQGEDFAKATKIFSLTIAFGTLFFFFVTIPPRLYSSVTCDNLSIGYASLTFIGGILLFSCVKIYSHKEISGRFFALGVAGLIASISTIIITPQCLRSPLANLDPMLVKFWLNGVTEAQSIFAWERGDTTSLGHFYAVSYFAILVCFFRILLKDRVRIHVILFSLLAITLGVGLVQIRGTTFANLIGILPISLLLIDLRKSYIQNKNGIPGLVYFGAILIGAPIVWAFMGVVMNVYVVNSNKIELEGNDTATLCLSGKAMTPINALQAGTVAAPSNIGVSILRFTPHRVLSAPYHRNQSGMLSELRIGLAKPDEAKMLLRKAGVTIVAYCRDDAQTNIFSREAPDGLYSAIGKGEIPSYLEPINQPKGRELQFFRFRDDLKS